MSLHQTSAKDLLNNHDINMSLRRDYRSIDNNIIKKTFRLPFSDSKLISNIINFEQDEKNIPKKKVQLLYVANKYIGIVNVNEWKLENFITYKLLMETRYSKVYKTTFKATNSGMVIKVYDLNRLPSYLVKYIYNEIKIMSFMENIDIIELYAAFKDENKIIIAMERAELGSLRDLVNIISTRRMTECVLKKLILRRLVSAIKYMHSMNICHRDLKSENIFFDKKWNLKLGDFGVSINLNEERAITLVGTKGYMAPEVERIPKKMQVNSTEIYNKYEYTLKVDIWSLGILVYELLVGLKPLSVYPDIAFPKSISKGAQDFILNCLKVNPEDRASIYQLEKHYWLHEN
jgi:serine/threonine protein kinase